MPVPTHLRKMAFNESKRGSFTLFHLKCECGSVKFHICRSFLNKDEKKLCEPYYEALEKSIGCGYGSMYTVDENGVGHNWVFLTDDINGPKKEVFIPEKPVCATVFAVKVKCGECSREHLIFDSRLHGYSGKYGDHSKEELRYEPHYKKIPRKGASPVGIVVGLEHDESIDAFKEATGLDAGLDEYLSPILDLHSSDIVSYTISDRPVLSMVMDMAQRALSVLPLGAEPILHSDQGWQYQH